MENRIEKRMRELQQTGGKAFITYMTAGLPDMEGTKALIRAEAEAGIDVIELGIPFSDSTADGPVILETNTKNQGQFKDYNPECKKRRRSYIKKLEY